MQRLVSLLTMAGLLGGGSMYLTGTGVGDLPELIATARRVMNPGAAAPQYPGQQYPGQQPGANPGYGPPGSSPANAAFVPGPARPGTTIKIATYNIEKFGDSKAAKPHVMRVLGQVVQNFDIVAIQEITTKDEYYIDKFLDTYVNNAGRRYARAVGPRLGRTSYQEQYAFIYDTATVEINPQVIYTVRDQDDLMHREPFVAMFRARGAPPDQAFTFILINAHTDPDETEEEFKALAQAYQQVAREGGGEDDIILLGDLNTDVPAAPPGVTSSKARSLRPSDLGGLASLPYLYPVIRDRSSNTSGSKLNDNLLIHRGATTEFTGHAGVVDVGPNWGLTPDQAQEVSDHLPTWGEFSVYESAQPGRMAAQPTGPQR